MTDRFDYRVDEEKATQAPLKTFVPSHLSSPIYDVESEMLLDIEMKDIRCQRHKKLKRLVDSYQKISRITQVSKDPIGCIQSWVKRTVEVPPVDLKQLAGVLELWVLQRANLLEPMEPHLINLDAEVRRMREIVDRMMVDVKSLKREYTSKRRVELLKDRICFKEIEYGSLVPFKDLLIERDIFIFDCCHKHGKVIGPTSLFLCALDKMQGRFGLLLYWRFCDQFDKYPGLSIYDRGTELIRILEPLRGSLGQSFYSFLDAWEGYVTGCIVAAEEDAGCVDLKETMEMELRSILHAADVHLDLEQLIPSNSSVYEVSLALELTGLTKVFGYPTLKEDLLLSKLKEYGIRDKENPHTTVLFKVEAVARREFMIHYFRKHQYYPKLRVCPAELYKYVKSNKPVPRELKREYHVWLRVRFMKTLDFDYCPDQSDLIKDSAAAVNFSAWGSTFDSCAFNYRYGKRPPNSFYEEPLYKRRVVEAYLTADSDEVRNVIEEREQRKDNEEDHMAILCGKEGEIKPDGGRAFTKQTPRQRLFQTALEHNVAVKIFPYVPEQSMTDSEVRCMTRVIEQVTDLKGVDEFISLDLTKWCLNQRHYTTAFMGKIYDELFGLDGVYENSHHFFIDCRVFTNNRMCPPDYDQDGNPINGPFFMDNFIGGMEGMHQKKWTHIAECIIKMTLEEVELEGKIMGQGDNQVILVHYKTDDPDEIRSKRSSLLNALDSNMKAMNHTLKEKETWYSRFLHEYSKMKVYKGNYVSAGTKKASKLVPDINDGLFSFVSSCATICTITEGVAKADSLSDPAFCTYLIEMANFLLRKNIAPAGSSTLTLMTLLCFPTDFGGLPCSTYFAHTVRGYDDKVCLWISIYKTIQRFHPKLGALLSCLWEVAPSSPAEEPMQRRRLMEDIFSLNIKSLPSAEQYIKELTTEYLRSDAVTNPAIVALYNEEYSVSYDSLVEDLDLMDPIFPQIAHELLCNSNAGILIRLQGKLTSSKTIESVMKRGDDTLSLVQLIQKKNDDAKDVIRGRMASRSKGNGINLVEEARCPTLVAAELRKMSWGKDIVGLIKPPYQHQIKLISADQSLERDRRNSVSILVSYEYQSDPIGSSVSLGPYSAYIGSTTRERVKKPTIEMTEKTSFTRALMRLGKILSWFRLMPMPNLEMLTRILIGEKIPLVGIPEETDDISQVCTNVQSGNIFHRFLTQMEHSSAMSNSLVGLASHFNQSSNTVREMSAGGVDVTVFYQLIYICNMELLKRLATISNNLAPEYFATFPCKGCTQTLPQSINFDMKEPPSSGMLMTNIPERPPMQPERGIDIDVQALMEFGVGRALARNIDRNYGRTHDTGAEVDRIIDIRKESISLNDLRQLRFQKVFNIAMSHSRVCMSVVTSNQVVVDSLSTSMCFAYLAEVVIEGGLVRQLVNLLRVGVTEHNMMTQANRMSSFISRAVPYYIRSHIPEIISDGGKFLIRGTENHWTTHQYYHNVIVLKAIQKMTDRYQTKQLLQDVHCDGDLRFVRRYLRLDEPVLVPFSEDGIVSIWRSYPNRTIHPEVQPTIPMIQSVGEGRYPMGSIISYFSQRATAGGKLRIKALNYLGRVVGCISSAPSKYVEILAAIGCIGHLKPKEGFIYSLAEGSGGTFATLLYLFPRMRGLYNTLIRSDIDRRDDISDKTPPAVVALGSDIDDRVIPSLLSVGVTDILTELFKKKLDLAMCMRKPSIVTMDAESMINSNNLQFVDHLLPMILCHKPDIVIFKMFLIDSLEENLRVDYEGYRSLLVKPVTSNPFGPEVFLVVIKEQLAEMCPGVRNLERLWPDSRKSIVDDKGMGRAVTRLYFNACHDLKIMFGYYVPEPRLTIPTRYDVGLTGGGGCSLLCKRYFGRIADAIDLIHTNLNTASVFMCTRDKGTNEVLRRLMHDYVFLLLYHSFDRGEVYDYLFPLTCLDLADIEAYRRNKDIPILTYSGLGLGGFFEGWGDAKIYVREFVRRGPCTCNFEMRFWTREQEGKSLSARVNYELYNTISSLFRVTVGSYRKVVEKEKIMKTWESCYSYGADLIKH